MKDTDSTALSQAQFAAFSQDMENRMRQLEILRDQLEKTRAMLLEAGPAYRTLHGWYFEGSWQADRQREAAHPLQQPCGVYSEDGLYDLFNDIDGLCADMRQACQAMKDS